MKWLEANCLRPNPSPTKGVRYVKTKEDLMARSKRVASPTGVYHWITRGINRKHLFHFFEDYLRFRELLSEYRAIHGIQIFHYCFMPNHVHMLLYAPDLDSMAKFSHFILRRYTYYYCKVRGWAGSVFQKGYKSLVVEKDSYLLECGRYIERNPIKAALSEKLENYPYSSFRFYSEGKEDNLITPSPAYLGLSDDPDERRKIYSEYVNQIRVVDEMVGSELLKT